jgi:hypothetical protein
VDLPVLVDVVDREADLLARPDLLALEVLDRTVVLGSALTHGGSGLL